MGRRRTGVKKVRDVMRYSHTTDLSERQIARALGVSRTVVAKTLCAFPLSGLEYSAVEQMPDSELLRRLGSEKPPQDGARYAELIALFPEMAIELKKKGTTLEWLWQKYLYEHPDGYQYSQFWLHFRQWRKDTHFGPSLMKNSPWKTNGLAEKAVQVETIPAGVGAGSSISTAISMPTRADEG